MEETEKTKHTSTDAFAVYSLPNCTDHITISGRLSKGLAKAGGFIIQKFDKGQESPYCIQKDLVVHNRPFTFEVKDICTEEATAKARYLTYAQETIDAIRSGSLRKVVMSRVATVSRSAKANHPDRLYQLFSTIKHAYPKAFVFLYHIPGEGCWCGATPEVLIEKSEAEWMTMALAGTQVDQGFDLGTAVWGNKEVEEQRIIEEYATEIIGRLKIKFKKNGPITVRAGQVLHLQSTFRMTGVDDPLHLADSLHPGPAICGVPDDDALSFIKEHEDHPRQHYCGYIGPWDISGTTALYINLRSMRIYKDQFVLYLGGGLTADSVASSEWEETELKAKTMLSVIQQSMIDG